MQIQTSHKYKFLTELVCLPDKQILQIFPFCAFCLESVWVVFISFIAYGHNFITLATLYLLKKKIKNNQTFGKVHVANMFFISNLNLALIVFSL